MTVVNPSKSMQPSKEHDLAVVIEALLSSPYDIRLQNLSGKRVLLRADLNLPVTGNVVQDASRLDAVMPTIELLKNAGAKVIVASHLGRPNPKKETLEQMQAHSSLAPVAALLQGKLGADCFQGLVADCVGPVAVEAVQKLGAGQVCLLENTRFHTGDTDNSEEFAKQLAELCDVFVNDAFGVVHRDQGSVTGITKYVSECYPGLLIRKELTYLMKYMSHPVRPLGVIMGGSKVADKIGVLWSLIEKADIIAVGGRMAFTFLAAQGISVGRTQVEEAWLQPALEMVQAAADKGVKLLLPSDVLVSSSLDEAKDCTVVPLTQSCCSADKPCVPAGCYGVDIGPETREAFAWAISTCKTLFWNGPLGKYEVEGFAQGTKLVAESLAAAYDNGATTVIGGGDSVAAMNLLGLASKATHISTGGGASLELLEGKNMPGLRSLVKS